MFAVRCKRRRPPSIQQSLHQRIDFRGCEYGLCEGLDIPDKPTAMGDIWRHFSFERAITDKGDDRVKVLRRYLQGGFEGFQVLVVLAQRVLEFERALEELLRPLGLALRTKNPPPHVFSFEYENAVHRHDDVIDLRRAVWRV